MSGMTRISTLGFLLVALAAGCQSTGEHGYTLHAVPVDFDHLRPARLLSGGLLLACALATGRERDPEKS